MFGKKTFIAVAVLLLAYGYNAYKTQNRERTPVLDTNLGKIQGIVSESRLGRKHYEFLGVPYGRPPVGELRFEPPQPASKWDGVKDASKLGAECAQLQLITKGFGGAEDCLFLNVFVPEERKQLLPVMVWFHGGAFVTGSSNGYKPSYFMDEDVVLVTVNYRLAALGFLNTGDGVVRGNMGLKDQNLALKWVQQNIKSFGGDPNKVTIFGESAGSASTNLHMLSPMSKGLFSKAIMQSGTATGSWVVFKEPAKQAKRFASKFGCPTDNSEDMVKCLKKVDVVEFVNMHQEMTVPLREQITIFSPTLETAKDDNAFLTEYPMDILKSGKYNKVPVIAGVNSDEGLLSSSLITTNQSKLDQANNDFYFWSARLLNYPQENTAVSDKIRKFYFGDEKDIAKSNLIQNYTNIFSDRQFFVPLNTFVTHYSKDVPIYLYYFKYQGDFSFSRLLVSTQKPYLPVIANVIVDIAVRWVKENVFRMTLDHPGVCHADELPYFYNWQLSPTIKPSSRQFSISKDLVSLWASFASNDKPLKFQGQEWTKVKPSDPVLKYLQIDKVPSMINEPFSDRVNFWRKLNI